MLKELVDRLSADERWVSTSGLEAELVLQEPEPEETREPGGSTGLRATLARVPAGGLVLHLEQFRDGRYPSGARAVTPYWSSTQSWVGRWSDPETRQELDRLWAAATRRGANQKAQAALHLMETTCR